MSAESIEEPTSPWAEAMARAIEEARAAAIDGDVPVGAVMVSPDGAIVTGRNLRERDADPTAHAEIVAIRAAGRAVGQWRLEGWTMVVTLEPCAMCAGALVNARVARVVFGCRDPKAGAVRSLYSIADDVRLNHRLEVIEGISADICAGELRAFFAVRRAKRR
jgi:tRNA(adenine34) deaminase